MIKSAAIVKTKTSLEKLRLQKRKLKKAKEVERKATREVRPSPIKKRPEITDNSPPTRAELETKAKELGIKFDGRTKDKKLGQLIQEKLGE
jgi:hypothetical protein